MKTNKIITLLTIIVSLFLIPSLYFLFNIDWVLLIFIFSLLPINFIYFKSVAKYEYKKHKIDFKNKNKLNFKNIFQDNFKVQIILATLYVIGLIITSYLFNTYSNQQGINKTLNILTVRLFEVNFSFITFSLAIMSTSFVANIILSLLLINVINLLVKNYKRITWAYKGVKFNKLLSLVKVVILFNLFLRNLYKQLKVFVLKINIKEYELLRNFKKANTPPLSVFK